MKKAGLILLLIIWMIITLLLTCSIIGLFVVAKREDYNCKNYQGVDGEPSWMKFGKKLLHHLIKSY